MRLKKGDNILVISGKDKGRKGKIMRAFPANSNVMIEGLNLKKKHKRPRKEGEKGQVIEIPAPIHISNVKLVCPKCSKPSRTTYLIEGGKKVRICKSCKKPT